MANVIDHQIVIVGYEITNAMEAFLARFSKTKNNDDFLQSLGKDFD